MNAYIENICGYLRYICLSCWIFIVVFILFPITYVITSIVCCVPICCFNCCVFIIDYFKDKKEEENIVENVVKIVEVKMVETSLPDDTIYRPYTYSEHIEIQMTENPLHKMV